MEIGRVVLSPKAQERVRTDNAFAVFAFSSLDRHAAEDWGNISDHDKSLSDDALRYGGPILSSYIFPVDHTKIWIVTNVDRSLTTILFPDEY